VVCDGFGDRRASERSCKDTDKSDTDLDRRQKVKRLFNQVQGTPCPSIAVLRQVLKTHPTAESKATSDMAKIPVSTASAMMMAISRPSVFIWAMR